MVGFKGQSSLKQYMPMKPSKWGYKVWCRCDAKTGYMCDFQVYCGASGPSEHSLGTKVVLDLAKPLFGKGYHLYFDNFFSSVNLANILLTHKTGMIATTRVNRKKYPKQLHKTVLARGESKHHNVGDVDYFVWQNEASPLYKHHLTATEDNYGQAQEQRWEHSGHILSRICPPI